MLFTVIQKPKKRWREVMCTVIGVFEAKNRADAIREAMKTGEYNESHEYTAPSAQPTVPGAVHYI